MDEGPYSVAHKFQAKSLTVAREYRALLKKDLAEKLGVSASAVSQLESGRVKPNASTLAKIALSLNFPISFFSRPATEDISSDRCHFRSLRTSTHQERLRMVSASVLIGRLIESLEQFVEFPDETFSAIKIQPPSTVEEIESLAKDVRTHWGLGVGPIPNLVTLLESKGIIVARLLKNCEHVDAFSVYHRGRPLVFFNSEKGNPFRSRFDVAHELGHLVMHADCSLANSVYEDQANRFASAFIFPKESFLQEFPSRLVWEHLQELKERWGMTLAAILRRAFDLGLISRATYTRGNIYLRSTRVEYENNPGALEQPMLIPNALQLLERTGVGLTQVSSALGLRDSDVKELVGALDPEMSEQLLEPRLLPELPVDPKYVSATNKIHYYLNFHTRGWKAPNIVWLNAKDFKQMYEEMEELQRLYHPRPKNAPMWTNQLLVSHGVRSFIFRLSNIALNVNAESLPDTLEEMKTWNNKCLELLVKVSEE